MFQENWEEEYNKINQKSNKYLEELEKSEKDFEEEMKRRREERQRKKKLQEEEMKKKKE